MEIGSRFLLVVRLWRRTMYTVKDLRFWTGFEARTLEVVQDSALAAEYPRNVGVFGGWFSMSQKSSAIQRLALISSRNGSTIWRPVSNTLALDLSFWASHRRNRRGIGAWF